MIAGYILRAGRVAASWIMPCAPISGHGKIRQMARRRPLRQRHLLMMALLAILVPLVLVAALTARSAVPPVGAIPGSLVAVPQQRSDGWYELAPDISARIRIRQEKSGWELVFNEAANTEKQSSARIVELSAMVSAPSWRLVLERCIETKSTARPTVVPMKPMGGRMFATIEIGWA